MRRRSRAGTTLVEAVFAVSILVIVIGVPVMLAQSANETFRTGSTVSELDRRGRRLLDQVAERLGAASLDNLTPPGMVAPFHSSTIDFQRALDYQADAVVWGNLERIEFRYESGETNDGQDNDSDGLIDEGSVVWVEDVGLPGERATTLCGFVSEVAEGEVPDNGLDDNGNGLIDEGGLSFDLAGSRVNVRVTLERTTADGHRIHHTIQRALTLRN